MLMQTWGKWMFQALLARRQNGAADQTYSHYTTQQLHPGCYPRETEPCVHGRVCAHAPHLPNTSRGEQSPYVVSWGCPDT